ncbi:hypothetical protein [Lederbergia panacisoli]|uniref:hypothetical protein n=1 Tax=Lederbergia panacisoli TaxID=1255251 RepID=UPI00214A8CB2|nr:hypothetical protein [Lederbergia panacisoli]MCR2823888.1 hypothetical protein [Lederbergia panacisoli]
MTNARDNWELIELSRKLEQEAIAARNNADIEAVQEVKQQLHELQHRIINAQGREVKGNVTSGEPLFDAHLRVEESVGRMERALINLQAMQDDAQP